MTYKISIRSEITKSLYEALKPFALFENVRSSQRGNAPRSGVVWAATSSSGEAEITVEDFQSAQKAIAAYELSLSQTEDLDQRVRTLEGQ